MARDRTVEIVPTLRASDIHKGNFFPRSIAVKYGFADPWGATFHFSSDDNWGDCKACLSAWHIVAFGLSAEMLHESRLAISLEIADHPKYDPKTMSFSNFATFNDHPSVTKKDIADVWNAAMESLGFTESVQQ